MMKTRAGAGGFVESLLHDAIVDEFAGWGGASLGVEMATGRAVDFCVNHCEVALEYHAINHPATKHVRASVWDVKPEDVAPGRAVALAWFSPDCRHFSRARGAAPVSKRVRSLAWIVAKWARREVRAGGPPAVMMVENVREFLEWGPTWTQDGGIERPIPERKGETFNRWRRQLERAGYTVEWRVIDAATLGVPQHRRRLFVIARRDGMPIVWPKATHGPGAKMPFRTAAECIDWTIPVPSIFDRKKPLAEKTLRRIALGIRRFVLENPRPFIVRCAHGEGSWGHAAASIDKPVGTVTGSNDYAVVSPTLATIGYGERDGQAPRCRSVEEPMTAVVGGGCKAAVIAPVLTPCGGPSRNPAGADAPYHTVLGREDTAVASATLVAVERSYNDESSRAVDRPGPAVTAAPKGGKTALCTALLAKFRGDSVGAAVDGPCPTITSGAGAARPAGAAHALGMVAATLTQFRGTNAGNGGDVERPAPAITGGGTHAGLVYAFLTKYFGNAGTKGGSGLDAPAPTATGKDRFGLVTVELGGSGGELGVVVNVPGPDGVGVPHVIVDIGLRMLAPRELARCQGFPDEYVLPKVKSTAVRLIGNSVPPPVVAALVRANCPELCGGKATRQRGIKASSRKGVRA